MNVRAKVVSVIASVAMSATEDLPDDVKLVDLGMDSLDRTKLALDLEAAFDVVVSDEVADWFVTVCDVVNFMEASLGVQTVE